MTTTANKNEKENRKKRKREIRKGRNIKSFSNSAKKRKRAYIVSNTLW